MKFSLISLPFLFKFCLFHFKYFLLQVFSFSPRISSDVMAICCWKYSDICWYWCWALSRYNKTTIFHFPKFSVKLYRWHLCKVPVTSNNLLINIKNRIQANFSSIFLSIDFVFPLIRKNYPWHLCFKNHLNQSYTMSHHHPI